VAATLRRRLLRLTLGGAALALLGARTAHGGSPRVIRVVARRFAYQPGEIELKAGERVVIELESLDFVHGISIPDLDKRIDLVPGRITRLELQPQTPGEIEFLCDNFCGAGHEQMHGRFIVRA